ncbi:MAG: hypothetical protein CMG17_07475 [Candidatus Marinimicrobia bacterium]|jgi:DNA polymerase III sliding clamp (beta) subunit (PCNA family)|nr:hypothetical protein [Candidatus Neomarinimicrobiota bacterium]MAR97466.1 hypothetical protein [Candidatus Neomarinimicrobiota bacterium]
MAKVNTEIEARNGSTKLKLTRKQLESVVKIIGVVDDSPVFRIKEDKITAQVVDGSHVSLISLTWPANAFQNYETTEQVIAVDNLKDLLFAVKTAGMKDTITIEVDANSEYTISTKYQTATMKSLDPASISEPRSPDFTGLDYVQVFDVPSDFLRTALTGTERKSDEIDFGIDGRKIKIFASNEGGKWDYNFECNEVETTKEYTRHAKMTYSGNHLKPLFTALNGAKAVDISLRFYTPDGKHGPLEVTANLPDGANIKYLLAPRINDGV